MPRTPSPCCTPIVIYSSDDDESVQVEVLACNFTDNDDSHDSMHAGTQFAHSTSVSFTSATGLRTAPGSSVCSVASSTDLLCSSSSMTSTVLNEPISSLSSGAISSVELGNGLPKDIAQAPCFLPAQPIKSRYPSTFVF